MTVADLAAYLSQTTDDRTHLKARYGNSWRSTGGSPGLTCRPSLLRDEPPSVGDERWDALLAALAEHLAAKHDLAPAGWADLRVLAAAVVPGRTWVQRADALVRAPAAFRKHGVYLRPRTLKRRDRSPGQCPTRPGTASKERLVLLGDHLVHRGVVADVFIVSEEAMALAYDALGVTRDVDSLFVPLQPGPAMSMTCAC